MSPVPVAVGYQFLGLAWKVLTVVLEYPIIKRALDNWTKGTANEIDNWVWAWLKKRMGITDVNEESLKAEVAQLQQKYDDAKAAGIVTALKEPVRSWDMAALVIEGESPNSNIG